MSGKFGMILPSLTQNGGTVITAGSEASASLGAANLLDPRRGIKWRSDSRLIDDSYLLSTHVGAQDLQAVALIGDFTRGSGMARIVMIDNGSGAPLLPPYDEIPPASIVSESGFIPSASIGLIDNGISTPGTSLAVANSVGGHLFLSFGGAPTDPPTVGAGKQVFAIRAAMGALSTGRRSITVSLYQGATLLQNLGQKWVSDEETSVILYFPWDAAELDDSSGNDVRIYIDCTDDVEGTLLVDEVSWLKEDDYHINLAGSSAVDSGWFNVPPGPPAWYPAVPSSVPRGGFFYLFDTLVDSSNVYLFIRDDGTPFASANPFARSLIGAAPQYIEAGYLAYGPWWTHTVPQASGTYIRLRPRDTVIITDTGGIGGVKRGVDIGLSVSLPFLTPSEAATLQDAYIAMGNITPFYASLVVGDTEDIYAEGLFVFDGEISFSRQPHAAAPYNYTHSAEFALRRFV